ncbi:fimbria/pilus outer membrane usher protein [Stenotrophomonas maltophilia]|uniref:fimbria/pilus outer membrane usher protein n=1 Tax=Stenotrophomonas maltophilia TaxID=40324 RepID=UPI0007F8A5E0|nr:fimbria/pilus outer membrane usher protein [Stenotrophomonas maltophilia]OBU67666.1 fimbrial assembly protein [Stenotrophomonas maltophilia]
MKRHQRQNLMRRRPLVAAVVAALLPMPVLAAPKVEFNADMLFGNASGIDLERFERGSLLPGTYNADILLNGELLGRMDLTARLAEDDGVRICLSPAVFEMLSLNEARLAAARNESEEGASRPLPLPTEEACRPLSDYVPGASEAFDSGEQRLDISVPQIYLLRTPRGWVDPALWESGINAATLGYSISHERQRYGDRQSNHTGMTVDAGLNVGEWRLRHSGYLRHAGAAGTDYTAGRSYLQRNLPSLGAQLTVGESSTSGDMLQGVNYRGVNITTDARMLPDGANNFAPVVRGVAQTNARVTIRQRGFVIHETSVAPGPFEIDDLQIYGASGDIEVEVTEADGRVERFVVPFTAMPQLLRPGQQRYSITAGELRDDQFVQKPRFIEATLRKGLSNQFTGYGAATAASGYRGMVLGGAWSTPVGAFSGDITFSDARIPSVVGGVERRRGQSYRLAYNKALFDDNTNVTMAAYRYSTSDFLTLADTMRLRGKLDQASGYDIVGRQRSRLDLTVNQRLQEGRGQLTFTGSTSDYWDQNRRQTSFSFAYGSRIGRASYSISARRTLETSLFSGGAAKTTNSVYVSVSVPLGVPSSAPRLDVNASRDSAGRSALGMGIAGSIGDGWRGNYNASLSRDGDRTSYGASANYQLPVAYLNGSYNRSAQSSRLSLGASGGLVIHSGGLTLGQRLGETVGLLHVPGAAGAKVDNATGVKTDSRGYAVIPYMSPFRRNEVRVDPSELSLDVELSAGAVSAIPNAGAVVKMVLPTAVGRNALIEARLPDGTALPFGTDVLNEHGDVVGVVGQGSRLWVRGLDQKGELFIMVGPDQATQCRIAYDLGVAQTGEMLIEPCIQNTPELLVERGTRTSHDSAQEL